MAHVSTNLRMDSELLRQLKRAALEQNRSLSALARHVFTEYLGLAPRTSDARIAARQRRAIAGWGTIGAPLASPRAGHDELLYGTPGRRRRGSRR